jgi:hypothetical protein
VTSDLFFSLKFGLIKSKSSPTFYVHTIPSQIVNRHDQIDQIHQNLMAIDK